MALNGHSHMSHLMSLSGSKRTGVLHGIYPLLIQSGHCLRQRGRLVCMLTGCLPEIFPENGICSKYLIYWCPGAESNHRHHDFQSCALPTELPGRRTGPNGPLQQSAGRYKDSNPHCPERPSARGGLLPEAKRGAEPLLQRHAVTHRKHPGRLIGCNLNASEKRLTEIF